MLELRLAFRLLRQQPIVTLTTVFALVVGIGMAATGFTLLDSVLFSTLPYPNGDRFVLVDAYTEPDGQRTSLDAERFRLIREHASALEHVGAFRGIVVNLLLPSGELAPIAGALVTPGSVAVFPYAPILGRTLRAEDGVRGAPAVALLRESLWRRHFSANPAVVGNTVTIAGVRRTVVGVMPDAFEFPGSGEIWLPLVIESGAPGSPLISARTFGVLRGGNEPSAADAQVAALSKQVESADPAAPRVRIVVRRFTDALSQGLEVLSFVLVGCLVLVLVVIAANIANLVLARTVSRARELAVRTALGATRVRLITHIFTEVLIVGVVAAVIGLTASQAVLTWVRSMLTDMPYWIDFTASVRTMAFVAGATLLTACVAGVVPAFRATRRNTADVLAATTRTTSGGFGRIGGLMVGLQVALSIALLNGSLLMARGVAGYRHPTLHVPPHEVLTARVVSENTPAAAIEDVVARIPGVAAAGASSSLPGLSPETQMTVVDAAVAAESVPRAAPVVAVGRGFLETLGGTLEAGRSFNVADFAPNAPPVAIVNQPFVAKFFGGANPVGRRLRILPAASQASPEPWREIVGVVPDLGLSAGDASMAAGFYVPMAREHVFHIALRTAGDARRLTGPLRTAVNDLDPEIQIRELRALPDVGREDRAVFAGIGTALAALGGMALLLSVIATYAILSLSVTRRTREIGIRSALGATRRQVLQSIMGRTVLAPALGALAGIGLGHIVVAARGIFAFRLPESSGPWALPVLGTIMIAAALLSAWVPARRALAVTPAEALRAE